MKEIMRIQGLEVHYSEKDMNIINSYKINNISLMKSILTDALNTTSIYKTNRSINSLLNE